MKKHTKVRLFFIIKGNTSVDTYPKYYLCHIYDQDKSNNSRGPSTELSSRPSPDESVTHAPPSIEGRTRKQVETLLVFPTLQR